MLVLELAGLGSGMSTKEAALSADYAPAFAELLSALAPARPALDGESVDPETVSADWETEYVSRWMEDVEDSPLCRGDQHSGRAGSGAGR